MKEVIIYPTETVYALGVNAFDEEALMTLFALKNREEGKAVSVLVRDIEDIKRWAKVSKGAEKVILNFLPGALTLVLEARDEVPRFLLPKTKELGFRISSDSTAQKVVADFIKKYDAPLTCTSANISGFITEDSAEKILEQFGEEKSKLITKIFSAGKRTGKTSTVARIKNGEVKILREGTITKQDLEEVIKSN